jgi:uracil-DNA glycosylase
MSRRLTALVSEIRSCQICVDRPKGAPLPHKPRPVLRVSATARLAIFGQAPGARVHSSGVPFTDPSGVRLRQWMGVTEDQFYDEAHVAIVPMGFCFPGTDAKGADRPPRAECAPHWRLRLMAELPQLELVLLVGGYAQAWHLGEDLGRSLTETVENWRAITRRSDAPRFWPLPHPSWRNNGWLKKNPWFDAKLLPALRNDVSRVLRGT